MDYYLKQLEAACVSLEGRTLSSQFWQHVVTRFKALLKVAVELGPRVGSDFVGDFKTAVSELLAEVKLRCRGDFPLWWITSNQRDMAQCYLAHMRIDALYKTLGVEEAADLATWRDRFRDDRLEHERCLEERLELSTDEMFFDDILRSSIRPQPLGVQTKQPEAWPSRLSKRTRADNPTRLEVTAKVARLKERTAARIFKYADAHENSADVASALEKIFNDAELRTSLGKIQDGCKVVQGGLQLCLRASRRLSALMEALSGANVLHRALVANDFTTAVDEFLLALQLQIDDSFLLNWVATCQRLVAQVVHTHRRVDDIYDSLGIEEDADLAQWRGNLAGDRVEQEIHLKNKLASTPAWKIVNGAPSPVKLNESLALLTSQLLVWPVVGQSSGSRFLQDELKLSQKQVEFMKATLDEASQHVYRTDAFDWFVASGDIAYDRKDRKDSLSGYMFESTWVDVKTGERSKAAIKFLGDAINVKVDYDAFLQAISSWYKLENEHIIKLLGANHPAKSKFFVSELATAGNLVDFFFEEENRVLLWHVFIQAVQGLQYLHEKKIEHGGLSCTNILLTRPEGGDDSQLVVKLSDIGMDAAWNPLSTKFELCDDAKRKMRLWAPERLARVTMPEDFSRADTYSLGLCIIDAATGELPFGMMSEEEVFDAKCNGEPYERPEEGFTDAEWALVARMVDNNPANRPSLDEVIEEMQELDRSRRVAPETLIGA